MCVFLYFLGLEPPKTNKYQGKFSGVSHGLKDLIKRIMYIPNDIISDKDKWDKRQAGVYLCAFKDAGHFQKVTKFFIFLYNGNL